MQNTINASDLSKFGIEASKAETLSKKINQWLSTLSDTDCWQRITKEVLTPELDFAVHIYLYETVYTKRDIHTDPGPVWFPNEETINQTNITKLMNEVHIDSYKAFHAWSVQHFQEFWQKFYCRDIARTRLGRLLHQEPLAGFLVFAVTAF